MKILTHIATEELLNYREYDRVAKPAPCIPFVQGYTVEQVKEWMSTQPTIEPLELCIYGDKALLTDGNHRIAAAHQLGIKTMLVEVRFIDDEPELKSILYDQTISRFKPILV